MKLLLLLILIASFTLYGFSLGNKLRNRVNEIRDWKYSLKMLETEIVHSHLPLVDVCEKISMQFSGTVATFYGELAKQLHERINSAGDAFLTCLDISKEKGVMKQAEYEILRRFGQGLGQYDRQTEQKQIQLAFLNLEREEQQASDEQNAKEKMYRSLGFLSGLLVAILLI